jgi:DNA-directed RNA polymerase subunit RPC12/RpoP
VENFQGGVVVANCTKKSWLTGRKKRKEAVSWLQDNTQVTTDEGQSMSEILQRLVTYAAKALTLSTHGKQTTSSQETLEAPLQQLTEAVTQPEATSPSFDTGLPENWQPTSEPIFYRPRPNLYEYACKFCGVKLTTTYTLTMAIRCPDHRVLLQSQQVS